jgi:hypothetical protein
VNCGISAKTKVTSFKIEQEQHSPKYEFDLQDLVKSEVYQDFVKSERPKLTQKFKQEFTARVKSEANPESIKIESECDRLQRYSNVINRKLF